MAVDAQGNIYVAGWGYEPGVSLHGLVTRSSDQGATWTLIRDYPYPTDTSINFTAVGLDPAQNLYVVGLAGINQNTRLIVRKSADAGALVRRQAQRFGKNRLFAFGRVYGVEWSYTAISEIREEKGSLFAAVKRHARWRVFFGSMRGVCTIWFAWIFSVSLGFSF